MKICPDTNVLVRAVRQIDDGSHEARQSSQAIALLAEADEVVISLPVLCEFVWVLRSTYRVPSASIASAIRALIEATKIVCDRRVIAFGLSVMAGGGDFADAIIAELGFEAGAEMFLSFDQRAVKLMAAMGRNARLLD